MTHSGRKLGCILVLDLWFLCNAGLDTMHPVKGNCNNRTGGYFTLISPAIVMNAASTLLLFFALVSRNVIPCFSANS